MDDRLGCTRTFCILKSAGGDDFIIGGVGRELCERGIAKSYGEIGRLELRSYGRSRR